MSHSAGIEDEVQRQLPRLLPRIWRFALRLTRDKADAEDLVQRCCLRALERRWQWRPETVMLSWLFSITHTTWLNEVRARQRRRESTLGWSDDYVDRIEQEGRSPEHALMCRQIIEAVQALPEAQRLVMLLVAVEGLSYRETATILDIPIGTVMSRLARARITVGSQFLDHAERAERQQARGLG